MNATSTLLIPTASATIHTNTTNAMVVFDYFSNKVTEDCPLHKLTIQTANGDGSTCDRDAIFIGYTTDGFMFDQYEVCAHFLTKFEGKFVVASSKGVICDGKRFKNFIAIDPLEIKAMSCELQQTPVQGRAQYVSIWDMSSALIDIAMGLH